MQLVSRIDDIRIEQSLQTWVNASKTKFLWADGK